MDMHPLDEAKKFNALLSAGESIRSIAERYDMSVSAIYQRVNLCKLIDRLQERFRQGYMNLSCAAAIAALPAKYQKAFCEQYDDTFCVEGYHVHSFIHSTQIQLLPLVMDEQCENCKHRTYHTDRELFPEFNGFEDVCFKKKCYNSKLRNIISNRISDSIAYVQGVDGYALDPIIFYGDDIPLDPSDCNHLTVGSEKYELRELKYLDKYTANEENDKSYVWIASIHRDQVLVKWRVIYKLEQRIDVDSAEDTKVAKDTTAPVVLPQEFPNEESLDIAIRERMLQQIICCQKDKDVNSLDTKKYWYDLVDLFFDLYTDACSLIRFNDIYSIYTGNQYVNWEKANQSILDLPTHRLISMLFASRFSLPDVPSRGEQTVESFYKFSGMTQADLDTLYEQIKNELLADAKEK
jgi:hypothetical protein